MAYRGWSDRTRSVFRFSFAAAALAIGWGVGLAFAAPDVELGRYLSTQCVTCHRAATPGGAIPNIFGMAAPRLTTLVKAYRDKQLPNPVMQGAVSGLKDDDIEALAAYFAQTPKP
jgi:cytochrome c